MKVLVAHNRYRSSLPSGENKVVEEDIDLLRSSGVDVVPLIVRSDAIPKGARGILRAAPGPIYSRDGVRRFRALLRCERPDIVHVHNVFPLLSPWIVRIAHTAEVPVIQTVHNYRHTCINGMHFRAGGVCTDCVGSRAQWPGLAHGCYRGSRVQSLPMTVSQSVHHGTWRSQVDRMFVLTPFMRTRLAESGFDSAKLRIRPSWVPSHGANRPPGRDVLFVGRLEETKGVRLLIRAWQMGGNASGRKLRIVGEGELRDEVIAASDADPSISYLGRREPAEVVPLLDQAAVVVVPSLWFEGFPLAIAEAFERGRAVVTTTTCSAASVVADRCGWVVEPTVNALGQALANISQLEAERLGRVARETYERDHSPQAAFDTLMSVYEEVLRQ